MKEFLSQTSIKRILQYGLFMLVVLLLQNMVLGSIHPLGERPLILPAVAVAVGMFCSPEGGVIFSLIMGVFADMSFTENTVLFTILFPALSFLSGLIANFFVNRRFFAYMGVSAAGLLITGLFQMLFTGASDAFSSVMIKTVLLQTLWSIPFAAAVYYPPAKWIE